MNALTKACCIGLTVAFVGSTSMAFAQTAAPSTTGANNDSKDNATMKKNHCHMVGGTGMHHKGGHKVCMTKG